MTLLPSSSSQTGPRVLALANQKGGVGKTTTAINLGTALAAIGEKVLILDLDPQGNASTGLGIDRRSRQKSTYSVLVGDHSLAETIQETSVPRLSISPSTMDLSGVELEIAYAERDLRPTRLRRRGEQDAAVDTDYSYVLIDCPPSLNLLTINAMAAADAILVPLQCEFFALEGLSQLMQDRRAGASATLNPRLTIHGIVLTMYDARNNLVELRSSTTCDSSWATRSTRPSFPATSGCPRRRATASRCCSTT